VSARVWTEAGTIFFLDALDRLGDADLDAPTLLPSWTRRHLIAHVHFNALALCRLVSWAATGVESRMYASPDQRGAEIEEGATLPPQQLRGLVRESASGLAAALDALSPEAWSTEVVTAQGRTVPATEIPWMRAREVMVHSVDLDADVTFEDLPSDFTVALLVDVVRKRAGAGEGPALAAWLSGRVDKAPTLGPWL
jgi:maleylpyruvate isomerase